MAAGEGGSSYIEDFWTGWEGSCESRLASIVFHMEQYWFGLEEAGSPAEPNFAISPSVPTSLMQLSRSSAPSGYSTPPRALRG